MDRVPTTPSPSPRPTERATTERGIVTLILGCMFSGKTSLLLRRISTLPASDVLAVKHAIDRRYAADAIVSHAGSSAPAASVPDSSEIIPWVTAATRLVAVDEAHFFDPGIVSVIEKIASRGINVVLASLEPDSWGRPFAVNAALREISDECLLLRATCARCRAVADRTQRLTPVVGGRMVVGPEHYEPRCRSCWRPPVEA